MANRLLKVGAWHVLVVAGLWQPMGCNRGPSGTSESEKAGETVAPTANGEPKALAASGERIYKTRCMVCHGQEGAGDGPGAAALNPKPRTLRSKEWQQSVTDEHIRKVITEGGPAVGLSQAMPAHPDLAKDPAALTALVEHVRSLSKRNP